MGRAARPGRRLNGVRLDPGVPERRVGGKLELLGIESADPAWVRESADAFAGAAHRLRALGAIAVSLCQVAGARLDGMVTLRRSRSVDVAAGQLIVREAGGFVAFTGCSDPLGAPLSEMGPCRPWSRRARRRGSRSWPRCRVRGAERLAPSVDACHHGLMVDWQLAAKVAEGVAALQPSGDPAPFRALVRPADEAEQLVSAYTGLKPPPARCPWPRAWTAPAWIDANVRSMRGVLDPAAAKAAERHGRAGRRRRRSRGRGAAVEAGAISGFLAGRVLGQYEFPVLDPDAPARLLFVAPNLGHAAADARRRARAAAALGRAARDHARAAVRRRAVAARAPRGMVLELTSALDLDPTKLFSGLPGLDDLRGLVDAVREGGLAAVVLGTERRELMDRVQAFMAVLEGYAEHVMDAVGADVIDDLPRLRAALERRRADRTGLLRLFEKLIGMDMKLRQYEQGKRFCDGVVERAGSPGSTASGRAPSACRRWPSWTTPRAGWPAPSPPRPDDALARTANAVPISHEVGRSLSAFSRAFTKRV